jgi:hypothetical protein
LQLPGSSVRTAPHHGFTRTIPDRPTPVRFSLRSGAVVILTSAARSGGEVRITEAERPRPIHPGQTGCQTGIAAPSPGAGGRCIMGQVCRTCPRAVRPQDSNSGRAEHSLFRKLDNDHRVPLQLSKRSLQIVHNCLVVAIRHAEADQLTGRNVAAFVRPTAGQRGRPSRS